MSVIVIIVGAPVTTELTNVTVRALRDYGTTSWHSNYPDDLDDEVSFRSAAYFRPSRPRKGAYVLLLPRPHVRPELEALPQVRAPQVRQDGWRLAVHTRHVTTSL